MNPSLSTEEKVEGGAGVHVSRPSEIKIIKSNPGSFLFPILSGF